MMLKLSNRVLGAFFLLLGISFSLFAREENNKDEYIWVLIESTNQKIDSMDADHSKLLRLHMDYLSKMHSQEKMLSSLSFQGGGGLMIFKNNEDSIKYWLSMDPAVEKGVFKLSYFTWLPQKGKLCQSDRSSKLSNVQVVFLNHDSKSKVEITDEMKRKHSELVKTQLENESTLFTGRLKAGESFVFISSNGAGLEEIAEFSEGSEGAFSTKNYKAWAPEATFCD